MEWLHFFFGHSALVYHFPLDLSRGIFAFLGGNRVYAPGWRGFLFAFRLPRWFLRYAVTENKAIDILRERKRRENEEPLDEDAPL